MVRREPIGVVGRIVPWNYPLLIALLGAAPALGAGNVVVLKPAEQTPLSALRLAELAEGIFPPGVFNVITGDGDPVGRSLVRHPDIDMISLVGRCRHRQGRSRRAPPRGSSTCTSNSAERRP